MSILKIARMGNPVLHKVAAAVSDLKSPEIQRLIQDMFETMADARGAGLAAPQVYQSLRLFVYHVPESRVAVAEEVLSPRVLINPEISPISDEVMVCSEGCLSIPGLRADVPRYRKIHYRGWNEHGHVVEGEAEGFHANVLQHEYDHLDGILYPQRIKDFDRFGYIEEIVR